MPQTTVFINWVLDIYVDGIARVDVENTEDADGLCQTVTIYTNSLLRSRERIRTENTLLRNALRKFQALSDVGDLFDGHDELNEYTHEENSKLMEAALDRIHDEIRQLFENRLSSED